MKVDTITLGILTLVAEARPLAHRQVQAEVLGSAGRAHADLEERARVLKAIVDVLGLKEAQATGIVDPDRAGVPMLVGAADDHIRKLAEDVLRRSSTRGQTAATTEAA